MVLLENSEHKCVTIGLENKSQILLPEELDAVNCIKIANFFSLWKGAGGGGQ